MQYSAVVGLMLLLLKHDQRGQEVADSEHNGAKSFLNFCSYFFATFLQISFYLCTYQETISRGQKRENNSNGSAPTVLGSSFIILSLEFLMLFDDFFFLLYNVDKWQMTWRVSDLICLKVSKSQKQFFFILHCPKNEGNIRQISALWS